MDTYYNNLKTNFEQNFRNYVINPNNSDTGYKSGANQDKESKAIFNWFGAPKGWDDFATNFENLVVNMNKFKNDVGIHNW